MNLRGIDLNLLVILDALLEEAHVSRAAERLNLSQPAASNALTRARALFGDPLLIRSSGGLRRTTRAEQLRGPLREVLAQMQGLIGAAPADLRSIRQPVRMVMSDFPAVIVAVPLLERVRVEAPGIDLIFHPWHAGDEIDRLRKGEIDLATTVALPPGEDLRLTDLGRFGSQVVMRRDHPAAKDFNLARWLDHPHILVSGSGEARGPVDAALARRGLSRRVGAVVPTMLLALELVEGSDLIATLPMGRPTDSVAARFAIREAPIELESYSLTLVRHRRSDEDIAVKFVAEELERLLAAAQINPASGRAS